MQVTDLRFLKPAKAVQDDDGHWYVIPAEMEDDFIAEANDAEWCGYDEFNKKYRKYMTGGDLNSTQLYAKFPPENSKP